MMSMRLRVIVKSTASFIVAAIPLVLPSLSWRHLAAGGKTTVAAYDSAVVSVSGNSAVHMARSGLEGAAKRIVEVSRVVELSGLSACHGAPEIRWQNAYGLMPTP